MARRGVGHARHELQVLGHLGAEGHGHERIANQVLRVGERYPVPTAGFGPQGESLRVTGLRNALGEQLEAHGLHHLACAAPTPGSGRLAKAAAAPNRLDKLAVAKVVGPDDAAARVRAVDTLGIPLGPSQPGALLDSLGRRGDWEELRTYGALLTVLSELFSHPNVHYLSGFFGPIERLLRDSGANIGFAPADFRRFAPLLEATPPRVMCTTAS